MNAQGHSPGTEPTAGAGQEVVPLLPQPLRQLRSAMDRLGIRYCHWKSNIRLSQALTGMDDVDLLVHREDATRFQVALAEAGFRRTTSASGLNHPGVFHALALDESSRRLVHVHGYVQIVGGDSLVKAYRLPVEALLLSDCRLVHGWPVPSAETELAVLVLRVALKHAGLIEAVMANRDYAATAEEVAWLRAQADEVQAGQLFAGLLPGSGPELFASLLDAVGTEKAIGRRVMLGLRLAWRLRFSRRLGPVATLRSRLHRVAVLARRRLTGRRDMVLEAGGAIVALVGPKATGKSTLADGLAECLGRQIDVVRIHAGKPPATLLSAAPRILLPLARRLFPGDRPSAYDSLERRRGRNFSTLFVLRMALLAYDRRALLRRSQNRAAKGTIIISDRYPSETEGAIDSSCFQQAAVDGCRSTIKRSLMRFERELHRSLPRPSFVLRLEAPVETAVWRDATREKLDGPDAAAVIRRWQLETQAEFRATAMAVLRTDAPLEQSLRTALREVWSRI